MQFGGITIDEEEHGAATLTVISLGVPIGPPGSGPDTQVALTVTGGRLFVGTHAFVTGALDRTRDQSLAARPEYQAALRDGGVSNAGVVFVDIGAAIAAYEEMMPAYMRDEYNLNQQPFLEPLSHLAMISTTENGQQVSHAFLYVK
jgi:hypothetical protein